MIVDIKKLQKETYTALKDEFGFTNPMQAPRLVKVVVSTGVGSTSDKKKLKIIEERLATVTGQKASPNGAKQSIATFKVRQGDIVGYQTTLRGDRMTGFLNKLINIAFPRTKDFRGISPDSVDGMGNYTIGLKESTIFPEISEEDVKDVFGMSVTVVTTAKSKKEAQAFLRQLGFPFTKEVKETA